MEFKHKSKKLSKMSLSPEKDLRERYRHTVEKILPIYGWPKWPPTEIPQPKNLEWWRQEIEVFPTVPFAKNPNASILQTAGLPQTGKTSVRHWLQDEIERPTNQDFRRLTDKVRLEVFPDGIYSSEQGYFIFYPLLPSPVFPSGEYTEPLTFTISRKEGWLSHFSLQDFKLIWWTSLIAHFSFEDVPRKPKSLVIGPSGPLDVMIFTFTQAAHQEDPEFAVAGEFSQKYYQDEFFAIRDLATANAYLPRTDAVILFGISQKKAQERRKKAGKKYRGLSDSPFFRDLSAWYGYWIENIFPNLHQYKGTGLLVLNGEASLEENAERITNYLVELAGVGEK
jgi:hypothetical protein